MTATRKRAKWFVEIAAAFLKQEKAWFRLEAGDWLARLNAETTQIVVQRFQVVHRCAEEKIR